MNKYIICPKCGAQYLPEEILYPNKFFGKPRFIERDSENKIIKFNGTSLDLNEIFICEFCDTKFEINVDVDFKSSAYTDEYVEKFENIFYVKKEND